MVLILLGLIFAVNAQHRWWGSRPRWRDHNAWSKILLDPAERQITGSRFESSTDRGGEGAACDCQGICGYGRGGSEHLMFANNKKSGASGCHWCGHGQYDPSRGNHDKIVYCYHHVCNPGYVSICQQSKHFSIWRNSYSSAHRACTCAKAAGQWKRVPGNFADNTITTSTTRYAEYTYSVTNTHTIAIEQSATVGVEIEGVGASSTTTLTEEFSRAVENSWMSGFSSTREIEFSCGDDDKDVAWQYVVYMYDVLCARGDGSKRFVSKAHGGCALTAFLMAGEGTTCTTAISEPPCCGPGANPTGKNDRKFCEDDYASWTGQCDGWSSRVKFTSIEDGRINCHPNQCPNSKDSSLQAHLSMCGATCANNAYANTFVPTHVLNRPNMLKCTSLTWIEKWLRNTYCKALTSSNHVVALVNRDCNIAGYESSTVEFAHAYEKAETLIGNWLANNNYAYTTKDFLPLYYNNWLGVCDGHMSSRRLLETSEAQEEVENCKCDPDCHKWGDCCNACAEARDKSHPGELMTQQEMEILGPGRKFMSEEEFINAEDALLK